MQKQRLVSIDILRFIATVLIFNHLAQVYFGDWKILASGGACGCSLFFFCSGYMLEKGKFDNLDVWYKRRLFRLLPTCIIASLISELNGATDRTIAYALTGGGWFVQYLLLFCLLYWSIRKCCGSRYLWAFFIVCLAVFVYGVLLYPASFLFSSLGVSLFGYNYFFNRFEFFLPFVLGVMVSAKSVRNSNLLVDSVIAIASMFVFYICVVMAKTSAGMTRFQMFVWVPLLSFVYYTYKAASNARICRIVRWNWLYIPIVVIGGLSLELYLVGGIVRDYVPRIPFPFRYFLGFVCSLTVAYLTRCLARIFQQTFTSPKLLEGYEWRNIFRIMP